MSDIEDLLFAAMDRLAQLESRYERTFRFGKILDAGDIDLSDPKNPTARIHVDDDDEGQPVKGAKARYTQVAGARKRHDPPSVGQQMLQIAPDGEFEAAFLIPLGPSDDNPSPSTEAGTYTDGTGQTDIRFKDGKHQVKAGDKTVHLITDKGQRIQVEDLSKLIIKVGTTAMKLKMDALEPADDIEDF